jgi:hypothetical protein
MIAHRGIQAFVVLFLGWHAAGACAQNARDEPLELVDFRNVTLHEAMRLLSMQTDLRIVPSAQAGKEKINLFLTNVRPAVVLSALADSNRFLLEEDKTTGVISIFAKEERKDGLTAGPFLKGGAAAAQLFPKIVLKGRILGAAQAAAALLEVDGKLLLVARQGMFSVGSQAFRVDEVTAMEVRIVEMQKNQVLILN